MCAKLSDGCKPLTRAAFWKLYHKYNNSVEELINSDEDVIKYLLKRTNSIHGLLDEMLKMDIEITTFLDEDFPHKAYRVLGDFCPPIFYKCGSSDINRGKFIGCTGSRSINGKDELWTKSLVIKNLEDKFCIVTGGAKGTDTVALNTCIENNGKAVLFLPQNMPSKIKEPFIRKNITDNKILVYSHVSPFALKTENSFAASALERNKFIYAMSEATVAVKADMNKGGTWAGALEAIKHRWTCVYTWDNKDYGGNQALIKLGALPLTDESNVLKCKSPFSDDDLTWNIRNQNVTKQLSVYDIW